METGSTIRPKPLSARYEDRLGRVTTYIYEHLDEELDLARLAEVAALSPYHWHRIYQAVFGETAVEAVRRLRLQRAASELANTALPVAEIARRAHYGSLPPFARVFKAQFGMPPARYRQSGSHRRFDREDEAVTDGAYEVRIGEEPALALAVLPHRGSYLEIGKAFDRLFALAGARSLLGPWTRLFGVYLDDPSLVPEAELRSLAGITVPPGAKVEVPLEPAALRGGRCATLLHQGPYADMRNAYRWLFGSWLPRSGEEAADAPVYEEYLNSPRDTQPTELRTLIRLPLKPRSE